MRTIADVNAEIAAATEALDQVLQALATLRQERTVKMRERDQAIIAAFDAGEGIKEIAQRLGMVPGTVNGILWSHGRRVYRRVKPISHLSAERQRAYAKARHAGIGRGAARQIAETVA